jgi:hypothetical protein
VQSESVFRANSLATFNIRYAPRFKHHRINHSKTFSILRYYHSKPKTDFAQTQQIPKQELLSTIKELELQFKRGCQDRKMLRST